LETGKVDPSVLSERIDHAAEKQRVALREAARLGRRIGALSAKKEQAEKAAASAGWKYHRLDVIRRFLAGIPGELMKARVSARSDRQKSERQDVTVAEAKRLAARADESEKALMRVCPHPFILGYPGHKGTYSYDYDDRYPGKHACVVCGHAEHESECASGRYETLTERDDRMVFRTSSNHFDELRKEALSGHDPLAPLLDAARVHEPPIKRYLEIEFGSD